MSSAAAVIDLESYRRKREEKRPASATMPWCPVWVWVMFVPVR